MKIISKASGLMLITAFIIIFSAAISFAGTHTVIVKDFAFSPGNLTIKTGDTVMWQNQDPHTHDVTGEGWGGPLPAGASYTYTFTTEGTYNYHCSIHPSMEGTIVVVNESAGTAAGTTAPGGTPAVKGSPEINSDNAPPGSNIAPGGVPARKGPLPDPLVFQKPLHVWLGLLLAFFAILQILVGTRILKIDFWFHRRLFPIIIVIILLFHGWYGFQLYFLK